jgi:hypothetical protein
LKGIPGRLGLRQFDVSIIVRSWDDSRIGLGNATDVEKKIRVDLGKFTTKVVQVSSKDVIASGGKYTDEDLKVGPITPPFKGSELDNNAITDFDPTPGSAASEVFFKITGPGMADGGSYYKKVGQDTTKNFRYFFTVRRTAEIP